MKNNKGIIMAECIALRAKIYATDRYFYTEKINSSEKAKVLKKPSVRRVTFDDYYHCLFYNCIKMTNHYPLRIEKPEVAL